MNNKENKCFVNRYIELEKELRLAKEKVDALCKELKVKYKIY